jgi:hypothetical protein
MNNTIAENKKTTLIVQVAEMDDFIIRGQVLVGDEYNHVGKIDYWSKNLFNINSTPKKED